MTLFELELTKNIAENGRVFVILLTAINIVADSLPLALCSALLLVAAMAVDFLTLRGSGSSAAGLAVLIAGAVITGLTLYNLMW